MTSSADPQRSEADVDARSPLRAMALVGAAFVALAGVVIGLGDATTSAVGEALLMATGAVAGLAGVAMILLWALSLRRGRQVDAAFRALLADDPEPAALTDLDGATVAASAALPGRRGAPLADGLAALVEDAPALVYRLANAARRDMQAVEESVGPQGPRRVSARRLSADRLLWRVGAPAPGAAIPVSDSLIDALPVAVARLDAAGAILFLNASARALLGEAARPGAKLAALLEGLGARTMPERIAEAARGDSSGRPEIARADVDGREAFLQLSLTRVTFGGEPSVVAVFADATELKTLEAQFVQSQKMQAVGQLAGGVAHDFNNLLTAITGHTDLLLQRHDKVDLDYADLHQIRQNANRAAGLVRQLLAFSRKQTLRPTVVKLVDALTGTSHLLNRLLGERRTLRMEHPEDLWFVKVDARQFEQVIMNLVVNARDAMPDGGDVLVRTANVTLTAEERRGRAVMPKGEYVRIDVIDSGGGISEDKIDQVFEPFFTTKKAGEGTGLGLSTVYGIVKQTGGFIFVDSAPGRGATFTVFLPRHIPEEAETAPAAPAPAAADATGSGVVLLVEDETSVRSFAQRALKLRGYRVIEAESGEEALDILADPTLTVDIIVSDVVMPGMDGPSCVRKARETRPDVKVLFMSGYAEDGLRRDMEGLGDCGFLSKPFSLSALTMKVKETLAA